MKQPGKLEYAATLLVAILLVAASVVAQSPPPDISAEPVPGQLDIMQGTAIKLGGAPSAEGPQPESFRWEIVQGTGGVLYNDEEYETIFQAPIIEPEIEVFVIRLTVGYPDGQQASNSIHLRVHRERPQPEAKQETRAIEDVMTDYYRKEKDARERNKERVRSNAPRVVHHSVGGYYGGYGYRGPGWGWGYGWGWPTYYPVYAPIVVPPPGMDWGPGDGQWDEPIAIPYDDLVSTFPEHIADDYLPQDFPGTEELPDMGYAGGSPADFMEIPSMGGSDFAEPMGDPGFEGGMGFDEPMVDPGFAFDDFGW